MKSAAYRLSWFATILATLNLGWSSMKVQAAEVACPSNLFPSPSGIYRNDSNQNVTYGATVQIANQRCEMADDSVVPPTGATPETVHCGYTSHFRVLSAGATTPTWVSAPVSMTLRLSPSAQAGVFDLEVLDLEAGGGLPNGMMIRESPTLASTGTHTVRQVASGTWYVSSFFDVFTELSMDGGMTWTPGSAAMRLELREPVMLPSSRSEAPPASSVTSVTGDATYPSNVVVRDLALQTMKGVTTIPPQASVLENVEQGRATGSISLNGGVTFISFECDYTGERKYQAKSVTSEARFYDTEMLSLSLSGGSLPGGVMVRESPSKASLGRTSIRAAADGLQRISGFFDVFTEISLDHGGSWSPANGEPLLAQYNPREISLVTVCPSSLLLPPMQGFHNGDVPNQEDLIEYPDGTILRGLQISMPSSSLKPPAPGAPSQDQNVTCAVQCEVSSDGGVSYETVRGDAATSVRVIAVALPGTAASVYDTELLALDFSAPLGSGATLMIRESPTRASTGRTTLSSASDGTKQMDSFFDVFTELSLDGGGSWSVGQGRWIPADAARRECITSTSEYPPADAVLACDRDITGPNGLVLRRVRVHALHHGSALPQPGGDKTFPFTSTATGELSTDGGVTFSHWGGDCIGTIKLTDYLDDDDDGDGVAESRYYNSELLSLELSGGGLGGVHVRESPSKASLGRTSVRTTPNNSFGTLSFFDVFTELSVDNGATWTPAGGPPVTFAFGAPPDEHFYPTASLPPAGTLSSPPEAAYSLSQGYLIRKLEKWTTTSSNRVAPPPPGGSVPLTLDGEMDLEFSSDGGATFTPVHAAVKCSVWGSAAGDVYAVGGLSLECRSLEFTIPTATGTIRVRESPTLASLGKTTLRQCSFNTGRKGRGSGYLIDAFFDVFIEVSIDNGIWSPRSNVLRLNFAPVAEQENTFATDLFPPRDGSLETGPAVDPVVYSSSVMMRSLCVGEASGSSRPPRMGAVWGTGPNDFRCECDLSTDGGVTWTRASAPGQMAMTMEPAGTPDDFDHEVESLAFTLPGGIMVRESPSKASLGKTSIRTKSTGFEGNACAIDSFFDVFTEISLDNGTTWLPAEDATHLVLHRDTTGVFDPSKWQPLVALHRTGDPDFDLKFEGVDMTISALTLERAIAITPGGTAPPPAQGVTLHRVCSCPAGLKARTTAAGAETSHVMKVEVGWDCTSDASSTSTHRVINTELTSLTIVNSTLPAGVMLRESPTRQSTGKTTIREATGGYFVTSFFDVFTELSLDGGQTWHAACAPVHMETVDASPPHPYASSSSTDPLPFAGFVTVTPDIVPRSPSGDKPAQAQFGALIDSSLNLIDDRHMLGLRTYDTTLVYQIGDTVVYNSRAPVQFGYSLAQVGDIDADGRLVYDMEVTAFNMQGGTLLAGMKIRESPTLPSRGRCERVTGAGGASRVVSFFDVFTEISHDGGTTWDPVDLPLHFAQEDRTVSTEDHGEGFAPTAAYVQRGTPIRCPDGTCRDISMHFTSARTALPAPGGNKIYPLQGNWDSTLVLPGSTAVAVSEPINASVKLTHADTTGPTRNFEAEVLSLSLTGTGGFMLRESPTRQSLGRHSITDTGGGNFRVGSFFDIFIEMSLDGGLTWSEAEAVTRLESSAPEIGVQQPAGTNLADGGSSVDYGSVLLGNNATRIFTVTNEGQLDLTGLLTAPGITIDGADATSFSVSVPPTTGTLTAGASTTFTVKFAPVTAGPKNAVLHIPSNDADENTFDIELTGPGSPTFTLGAAGHSENEPPNASAPVPITVNRIGGEDAAMSVQFTTVPGTAKAGADYIATTQTVSFLANGPNTQTVNVFIKNDTLVENNETFTVKLQSPSAGTGLGTPNSAPVTIIDPSALTDVTKPSTPTITAPAASPAFTPVNTGATVTITGIAKDGKGVSQVLVKLNAGGFANAVLTTPGAPSTVYTLAVTPQTGANSVVVRTLDFNNNAPVADATRTFTVTRPLAVDLAGTGTGSISPAGFTPSSFREVGKSFTLTATPTLPASPTIANPGSVFARWTVDDLPGMNHAQTLARIGVVTSSLTKATLTLVFREGLKLAVHFEKNPYPALAGTYNGLLRGTGTTPLGGSLKSVSTEGYFTATIDAKGGFSGKLTLDGATLSVPGISMTGSFDETGTARFGTARTTTVTVARLNKPSLTVGPLHVVDTDGAAVAGGQQMDGTVTATDYKSSVVTGVSTILAERAFYGTQGVPGSIVLGSPVVTMVSTADRTPEELVTGTGIPAGAKIQSVNSATQITLDKNATASNAAASLTFTRNVAPDYLGPANADGSYSVVLPARAPHYEVPVTFYVDNTVDAGADHLFQNGSVVMFKGTLPNPLVAGQAYHVMNKSGNTFNVSITPGGLIPLDITASGSGIAVLDPDTRQIEGFTAQDFPQGYGVATVKLTRTGTLTCTATLADGTAMTPSSTLSSAGTVPLFAQLYNLKGFFSTLLKLKDLPLNNTDPDLLPAPNSEVLWLRPFMLDQYYPDGWPGLLRVDLLGAKYDAAIVGGVLRKANNTPLAAADLVEGNAALTFSEGQLTEDVVKTVSISTTNVVARVPDPADPTFSLSITPATGVINGSFIHTDDNSTAFQGIIFQKGPNAGAYGFFKTKAPLDIDYRGESGGVILLGK